MRILGLAVLACIAVMVCGCDDPLGELMVEEVMEEHRNRGNPDIEPFPLKWEAYVQRVKVQLYLLEPVSQPNPPSEADVKGYLAEIDTLVKETQEYFASQMERLGYGRKTFVVDLDANGRVVVTPRPLKLPCADYETGGYRVLELEHIENRLPHWKDRGRAITVNFAKLNMLNAGRGGGGSNGGNVYLFNGGWNVQVFAHELGHAMGLAHDNRHGNKYMMSQFGSNRQLSGAAGKWLDRHHAFNEGPFRHWYGVNLADVSAGVVDIDALIFEVRFHMDIEWTGTEQFRQYASYDFAVLLDSTPYRWPQVIDFTGDISWEYRENIAFENNGHIRKESVVYTIDFDGELPANVEAVKIRLASEYGHDMQIWHPIPVQAQKE